MKIAVLAVMAMLVLIFLFLCAGSVIMKMRRKEAFSLSGALLTGFFAWFAVFEIICFICQVTLTSLSRLSVIILVISAAVLLGGTIYCGKDWLLRLKTLKDRAKMHGFLLAIMVVLTALVCFFALIYTDASADSDWYVGMASTALFTNSIGRFEPTTGMLMKAITPRYAYSMYPYHNAVIADLFHIPAITAARTVMSVINALVSCISFYELGLCLFAGKSGEDRETVRKADVFTILLLVLNVFSATIYLPGAFLFSRTFEGKHLVANVILPSVLSACVLFYRDMAENEGHLFQNLFLATLAGVCFSASITIAVMTMMGALLPYFLLKRRWRSAAGVFFAASPFILWVVVYLLNAHHVFVFLTYR